MAEAALLFTGAGNASALGLAARLAGPALLVNGRPHPWNFSIRPAVSQPSSGLMGVMWPRPPACAVPRWN